MGMTTLCQEVFKALKGPNRPRSRPRKFELSSRRKCRQDYRFAVPKGLMIVARYEVPGSHEKKFRPVGNGLIRTPG